MKRNIKPTFAAALLCFTGAASFAACGSSGVDDLFPGNQSDAGRGGGGSGAAGGGGGGGQGGGVPDAGPPACDDCSGATPICVDGDHCAAACPEARVACSTAGGGGLLTCCDAGAQCCSAQVYGYRDGDRCVAQNEPCPVVCPDGVTACPGDQFCQLDVDTNAYECVADCSDQRTCDQNLCCPLGTECTDGACRLPDIKVDEAQVLRSLEVTTRTFASDACEIFEGCIMQPGERKLLRFDLRTPNIGEGDLFLGHPEGNPLFEYSSCHGHYHFNGYANYHLLNEAGEEVGTGHKQAFCLLDLDRDAPDAPREQRYDCGFQGIQAGWADVYDRDLPCQWVDVTDVPPGSYTLQIELNRDHTLAESDFTNNTGSVPVTIAPESCVNGCRPVDETCCRPDDPCGWAADGSCDCADTFGWDSVDCSNCNTGGRECTAQNSCPGGCASPEGACDPSNPLGLANNGVCECGGLQDWDVVDCEHCATASPECPVNSCPRGCSPLTTDRCCANGVACGWDNDGECDCGGAAWDAADCATCISSDADCP